MKKSLLSLCFLLSGFAAQAQSFHRGADISWYSEMVADGKNFYNTSGAQTECNALMKECGMNAIRLRVWVEPTLGGWCGTEDVVTKALAAKAAGLDVLIDFHYADFFADPGQQPIPAAWQGGSINELAQHVADHTTSVLTALKMAGVTPKWVQLGNETRNGMLYSRYVESSHKWEDMIKSNSKAATGSTLAASGGSWSNYATLSNAGYDAAKAIFPDIICISHLNTTPSDTDLSWWFTSFKNAGGKLDMVGLSHYPMGWNSGGETQATKDGKSQNANLMTIVNNTYKTVKVPVMIVETGVYCEYTAGGKEVMQDLLNKCRASQVIQGVFYWEPEQYNWWKPAIYSTLGWGNYNMCAFLNNGRPSAILDPFQPTAEEAAEEAAAGISNLTVSPAINDRIYNLAGQSVRNASHGVYIKDGKKVIR